MTKLSKPVATIETLKRLVTNSNNKYATKDSLSTVATTGNYSDLKGTPTSLPANGGNASTVNGHTVLSDVPANAKFTDTVYTHPSTHPASMITGLATVATSGSYNDLSNKPTIPTSLPANGGNSSTVNGHTVLSNVPANAKFTDTVYSLPDATTTTKGGVKVGSNLTVASGTISLTKDNVTGALGYTPPTTNTTYSASNGISLSGTTFSNSGVRSIATGSANGTISVNTNGTSADVAVKGLGSAAYTASSAYAPASHTHNYAGSSSAGGSANSAVKLATARTIAIGTGATGTATSFDGSGNITIPITNVKESYLSWGGKNFSGDYGCIDAAMIPDLGANRLAFGKAAGITVQYSTNGGSTWSDYGLTDTQKTGIFGTGTGVTIGKATSSTISTKCMLRITIDTDAFNVYTALNKFAIYLSTNGCSGSYCTIEASKESTPTTFETFASKIPVSGWSGWNIINTSTITTYGNNASNQYGLIRFTFGCTGVSTSHPGLTINRIMGFGGIGWTTPSNMAKYGTIYSYDNSQNVTFPASVTATSFSGSLSGNASTATKATQDSAGQQINTTYIKGLSVSGTTITYTKGDGTTGTIKTQDTNTVYTHPTTHPASMITGLATVATSGSYNDLSNKPTSLPANGGAATTATKLTVNAGSATVPTYFTNGVPTACTGISVATITATTTLNIPGGKIWIE